MPAVIKLQITIRAILTFGSIAYSLLFGSVTVQLVRKQAKTDNKLINKYFNFILFFLPPQIKTQFSLNIINKMYKLCKKLKIIKFCREFEEKFKRICKKVKTQQNLHIFLITQHYPTLFCSVFH